MSLRRLAWFVWVVCVGPTLVGLFFLALNGGTRHANSIGSPDVDAGFGVLVLTLSTVGAAVASRRPGDAIHWPFSGGGHRAVSGRRRSASTCAASCAARVQPAHVSLWLREAGS